MCSRSKVYWCACCNFYAVLFFIISLLRAGKWVRSRISMQRWAELGSKVLSMLLFTSCIVYLLQKMLKFLRAFWHLVLSSLIGRFAVLPASLYYTTFDLLYLSFASVKLNYPATHKKMEGVSVPMVYETLYMLVCCWSFYLLFLVFWLCPWYDYPPHLFSKGIVFT